MPICPPVSKGQEPTYRRDLTENGQPKRFSAPLVRDRLGRPRLPGLRVE